MEEECWNQKTLDEVCNERAATIALFMEEEDRLRMEFEQQEANMARRNAIGSCYK